MVEEPVMEPLVVEEAPVTVESPAVAEEPVEEPLVVEDAPVMLEAPLFAEEEPVVAAEESFYAVEPSPFMADADAPVVVEQDEAWFVADVQEPAPAPEPPAKSDTWSGRSIGS